MIRPFGSASALELRRRQAVLAVNAGEAVSDLARHYGGRRTFYPSLGLNSLNNRTAVSIKDAKSRRERRLALVVSYVA